MSPVIATYSPFDPAVIADPYPWYEWLRSAHPVYRSDADGIWVVSRYDDVVEVLRRGDIFSSADGIGYAHEQSPMMIALDRPEHTVQRRVLAGAFIPRAVEALRPRIRQLIDAHVDRMLAARRTDWWAELAGPLPVSVIAALLGLPAEMLDQFRAWSEDTMGVVGAGPADEHERARRAASVRELNLYLRRVRRQRASAPGVDLISFLIESDPGEPLDAKEIVALARLLLVAGAETTTHLLTNGMNELLDAPDQWEQIVRRPALVPLMVEEMVRYQSPIQGFYRSTTCEWHRHGEVVPAGARVLVLFGSANRDERRFDAPAEFRIGRAPNPHVGFGSGIHRCLGAALARLQARLVWETILERGISFERSPGTQLVRGDNPVLRSTRSLPVMLTATT